MESAGSVLGGPERRRLAFSPERCKLYTPPARVIRPTAFKKVEIVYYLTKNGHLEHPHFMEITHAAHRHLRLRDFMDRLTALRGKGMPSLYSWSCKRIYKNGYVWNDLSENDVIFPSEGDEYVLKGSELVLGCSEKMSNLETGAAQELNFQPKRRFLPSNRRPKSLGNQCDYAAGEMGEEAEEEYQEKTMYTRCSRNVSTEEYQNHREIRPPPPPPPPPQKSNNSPTELILDPNTFSVSPPSTASSDNSNTARRYEDGDPLGVEPMLSRNSMLLSLIACGGLGSFRKTTPPPPPPPPTNDQPSSVARKSSSLHRVAVSKAAAAAAAAATTVRVLAEEEEDMINYMPGNPRFGNLQSQEKEYFSGSIVDTIATEERLVAEPRLKKSSSYNQEKSLDAGLGAAAAGEKEEGRIGKGHNWICIPRKNKASFSFNHLDD